MYIHPNLKLISSTGFVMANKSLARVLGLNVAVLFGELAAEYIFYAEREQLIEDCLFFSTIENLEYQTTLSAYQQREAIKKLEGFGLIETVLKGVPATKYFKLNPENLTAILSEEITPDVKKFNIKMLSGSSCEETSQPDVKKLNISLNNNKNKNENNNSCYLEDKKENKQIIKRGSTLTGLQALEVLKPRLNPEVYETLKDFIQMRKTIKKPITAYGLRLLVDKLLSLSTEPKAQIEILNRSILNCWQDIFDPNERKTQQPQRYQQREPEPKEEEDVIEKLRRKYAAEEAAKEDSGLLEEE